MSRRIHAVAARARRSWWRARSAYLLLAGGTAALAAAAAATLALRMGWTAADPRMVGLVVGIAMIAVAFVVAWRRAPSLIDAARALDRHHVLHERLSTALELSRDGSDRASLVATAAMEDASATAGGVEASAPYRFRWPRWAWSLPVAALALGAVSALAPLDTTRPPSTTTSADSAVDVDDAQNLVERAGATAERLARLLDDDPSSRDDAYIRAVSEGLDDLAERARSGDLDAESAQLQLDRLLGHLRRAVEERDDAIATLVTSYLDSGVAHDDGLRPPEANQPADADGEGQAPPADVGLESGSGPSSLERTLADLERALEEAERAAAERPERTARAEGLGPDDHFYGLELDRDDESAAGLRQQGDAAGAPVGAADESDDRAGDAAGDGRFESDAHGPVSLGDRSTHEDLTVVTDEIEGGRRVTIESTPIVSGPRRGGATIDGTLPSHRVEEAAAGRETVARVYVDVVSRYFHPDLAEQRAEP